MCHMEILRLRIYFLLDELFLTCSQNKHQFQTLVTTLARTVDLFWEYSTDNLCLVANLPSALVYQLWCWRRWSCSTWTWLLLFERSTSRGSKQATRSRDRQSMGKKRNVIHFQDHLAGLVLRVTQGNEQFSVFADDRKWDSCRAECDSLNELRRLLVPLKGLA